ncbi:MAG: hypothetical protein DRI36_02615, partial [Caldiserica bacterium]
MIGYDFTKYAEKQFLKLPKKVQQKIIKKLEFYLDTPDPLVFALPISKTPKPCYRFKIGNYRVIFDWEIKKILILAVG